MSKVLKQCNQYDIADNRSTQFGVVGLVLSLFLSRTAPARRLEGQLSQSFISTHGVA